MAVFCGFIEVRQTIKETISEARYRLNTFKITESKTSQKHIRRVNNEVDEILRCCYLQVLLIWLNVYTVFSSCI